MTKSINSEPALRRLPLSEMSEDFVRFQEWEVNQSIPNRFENMVKADHEASAIRSGTTKIDYGTLNRMVNRMAHALLHCSTRPESPITLLVNQGITYVIAVLGILKSGHFLLPLDPEQPAARNRLIVDESGSNIIITEKSQISCAQTVAGDNRNIINADVLSSTISSENPDITIDPDSIAQIVYTSGSTGSPKGVIHTHRQILHNVMRHTNTFLINRGDRQTLLYPTHVYAGTREIYNSLLNGACLCHYSIRENPAGLAAWVEDEGITIYCSVTTIFRYLLDTLNAPREFPRLRIIKLGGETTYKKDIDKLWSLIRSNCFVHCGLGISETGLSTHYFFNRNTNILDMQIPLGYPSQDMELLILDENRQPVPQGEVGEIAVRSRYVSSGYWLRPELTRVAFLRDDTDEKVRTYLTGDKGRFGPDGCLEYHGRRDHQVKISGNRVDLTEIEQKLMSLDSVREAAVVIYKDARGQDHLVGYWTPDSKERTSASQIRQALAKSLPIHAVPTAILEIDRMPLTPTGKINKHALPAPKLLRDSTDRNVLITGTTTTEKFAEIVGGNLRSTKIEPS